MQLQSMLTELSDLGPNGDFALLENVLCSMVSFVSGKDSGHRASQLAKAPGALDKVVQLSQLQNKVTVRFQALWVLANVAGGTHQDTEAVVHAGGVKVLIDNAVAEDSTPQILEVVFLAICNLTNHSNTLDQLLANHVGLLNATIATLHQPRSSGLFVPSIELESDGRRHSETVENMICHILQCCLHLWSQQCSWFDSPMPSPTSKQLLKGILSHLSNPVSSKTFLFAAKAVAHHSRCQNWTLKLILKSGALPQLITRAQAHHQTARHCQQWSCYRILSNLLTADHSYTDLLLAYGFVPLTKDCMKNCLRKYRTGDKKSSIFLQELCFALSNVAAGTVEHMAELLTHDIFGLLYKVYYAKSDVQANDIRSEIRHVIVNGVCTTTSPQMLRRIFKQTRGQAIHMVLDGTLDKDAMLTARALRDSMCFLEICDSKQASANACNIINSHAEAAKALMSVATANEANDVLALLAVNLLMPKLS